MNTAVAIAPRHHIFTDHDNPYVPGLWTPVEHRSMGVVDWDEARAGLFLASCQTDGVARKIHGSDQIRAELVNQRVLNSNFLDFLLDDPSCIPLSHGMTRIRMGTQSMCAFGVQSSGIRISVSMFATSAGAKGRKSRIGDGARLQTVGQTDAPQQCLRNNNNSVTK